MQKELTIERHLAVSAVCQSYIIMRKSICLDASWTWVFFFFCNNNFAKNFPSGCSCEKVLTKCHPCTQHENEEICLSRGTCSESCEQCWFFWCRYVTPHTSMCEGTEFVFGWMCGAKCESHIHSLYLAWVETDMFDNVQQFCTARGVSYNVRVRNFWLIERTERIGDRLCSAKKCVEVIVNASKSNRIPVKAVSTQDVLNLKSTVAKILPKRQSISCKGKPT
jgi:hypothetical protein